MSTFGCKDSRAVSSADPSWPAAMWSMLARHLRAALLIAAALLLLYAGNVAAGLRAHARTGGTIAGVPVFATVSIARDKRGIPHVAASSLHDLFLAEGFAQASDRLFEMDLSRRYAYGTLAEIFGKAALGYDEALRAYDVRGIARREWRFLDPRTKAALQAFSAGVNAAERVQPLPAEFRMLAYEPAPWTPRDSLAISVVAMIELSDSWQDVEARSDAWNEQRRCFDLDFPLSDPRYDVTVTGERLHERAAAHAGECDLRLASKRAERPHTGSNAWAAGAKRTRSGDALIANDPHVDVTIPGIWYVVELDAPGLHAAGAVLPGLPGVTLGHNDRLAWAVTNAQVATSALYHVASPAGLHRVVERFGVRFGSARYRTYYRTSLLYSVPGNDEDGITLMYWPPYFSRGSAIATNLALDCAPGIASALAVLKRYRGSPESVILADTKGYVAYHLAGEIPDDPAWGRYVHPARDLRRLPPPIPFEELPLAAASRNAILLSANNRMYGPHYRYRLSPSFEPPYRAYRIAALLHARRRYTAGYFERMQMDAYSPVDVEIARGVSRLAAEDPLPPVQHARRLLARWNGRFDPNSRAATLAYSIREYFNNEGLSLAAVLAELREAKPDRRSSAAAEAMPFALWTGPEPLVRWGAAGQIDVDHPLSPMWYGLLRGRSLPGDGNGYTIHLQEPGFAQGFRAVWDAGRWDRGGIVIPSGESGEPGSPHYDDLAGAWIAGKMVPLAFSRAAVRRATVETLILRR
jgi:penicillin amidase